MWQRGWGDAMADLLKASGAAIRATDVLLRGTGGRAVLLRLPAPAIPGGATEQLGLAIPQFQDMELAPVAIFAAKAGNDKTGVTRRLVVSATAVNGMVGSLGYSSASVLFATAFGVVVDGVTLEVLSAVEYEIGGVPYAYQLTLRVPVSLTV
jgi:hypothetical protein